MDGKEPISSSFHGTTTHSKVVRTSNAFSRPTELPFPLATYLDMGPTGKEGVVVRWTSRLKTYYDDVICQWHHDDNRIDVVVSHSQPAVHGWKDYALHSPILWTRNLRSKQVFAPHIKRVRTCCDFCKRGSNIRKYIPDFLSVPAFRASSVAVSRLPEACASRWNLDGLKGPKTYTG